MTADFRLSLADFGQVRHVFDSRFGLDRLAVEKLEETYRVAGPRLREPSGLLFPVGRMKVEAAVSTQEPATGTAEVCVPSHERMASAVGGLLSWVHLQEADDPRRVMAKVAIWLHWLASLLAISLLAVPPTSLNLVIHIVPLAIGALAFSVIIHRFPWERIPRRLFAAVSLLDTSLIGLGVAFSGGATSRYQLLFALVVVFAAYFYPVRDAAAVTVVASLAFSAPLVYSGHRPGWAAPMALGSIGALWIVAAVVKETVLRVERERGLRDAAETQLEQLYANEVDRRTSFQQKSKQLESILEMGNAFRLQLGLDAILDKICSAIGETVGFRAVLVRLFDPDTGAALCRAAYGVDWDSVQPPTPPELIRSLMDPRNQVSRSYLVEVSPDDLRDPQFGQYLLVLPASSDSSSEWREENSLIVPLETRDQGLIGIISIDQPVDGKIPSLETIQALEIFANLAATAIENATLFAEAGQARALRELDRLKSEFLAAVSHDLRTPLTVIKGSVDLLDTQSEELSVVQRRLLAGIGRNTQRLISMVEQLLEMIQLQEGRVTLQLRLVDIREVVADAVESLTIAARERGQTLVVHVPPGAIHVMIDPNRIQQVLANLITNACKYGPEASPIDVDVTDSGASAVVTVHDTGGAIPQEEQRRIFDRFYRTDAETTTVPGTGLGLAICRSLIDLHGGDISVSSSDEVGTIFRFTLPKEGANPEA